MLYRMNACWIYMNGKSSLGSLEAPSYTFPSDIEKYK